MTPETGAEVAEGITAPEPTVSIVTLGQLTARNINTLR
jgi:hypothetical protein